MTDSSDDTLVDLTVGIVSAYVANNTLPTTGLAGLIAEVHAALGQAVSGIARRDRNLVLLQPAVSAKKSVTPDHIVCLEDGKTFKSLKRHLRTAHGTDPGSPIAKNGACRRTTRWWLRTMLQPVRNSQRRSGSATDALEVSAEDFGGCWRKAPLPFVGSPTSLRRCRQTNEEARRRSLPRIPPRSGR